MSTNLLPDFFARLNEAHAASEEVDLFDLTDKPESKAEFAKLQGEQRDAATALIEYVQVHGADLLGQLEDMASKEGEEDGEGGE